jgi:hypothetical protein
VYRKKLDAHHVPGKKKASIYQFYDANDIFFKKIKQSIAEIVSNKNFQINMDRLTTVHSTWIKKQSFD